MTKRGVAYIAIGDNAERELSYSCASLHRYNPGLPFTRYAIPQVGLQFPVALSRIAKLTLFEWCPYDHILYLDADTRVFGDVSAGFDILADGWDMAIAPSNNQGEDILWHVGVNDRDLTFECLGTSEVLQLQAGVFFVARNARVQYFFDVWYNEWQRFRDQDQAAIIRALQAAPLKIWLLGRRWNDHRRGKGAVIEHWFGRAR
jgi:hypothetical protein